MSTDEKRAAVERFLAALASDGDLRVLDELCTAGRTLWTRLRPLAGDGRAAGASLRSTPVLLLPRRAAPIWSATAKRSTRRARSTRPASRRANAPRR